MKSLDIIEVTAILMCIIDGLMDAEVIEFTGVARGTVKRYRKLVEAARSQLESELVESLVQGIAS